MEFVTRLVAVVLTIWAALLINQAQSEDEVIRNVYSFCKKVNKSDAVWCVCEMDFKKVEFNAEFNLGQQLQCENVEFVKSSFLSVPRNVFKIANPGNVYFLTNCQLTTLEVGNLDGIENVEVLFLDGNLLTVLQNGFLGNASNLVELSIASNSLTTLESNCFNNLWNLRILYLENNSISTLPDNVFEPLQWLQLISLGQNQLKTISPRLFTHNSWLTHLSLDRNIIVVPSHNIFQNMVNLKKLNFKGNRLLSVPPIFLSDNTALEDLNLSGNQISELDEDSFHNNALLTILQLQDNKIVILPERVFKDLTHLQKLYLDNNRIIYLPAQLFLQDTHAVLETISLAGNKLVFGDTLGPSSNDESTENILVRIQQKANTCMIGVFGDLLRLEYLNISGNTYRHISSGSFNKFRTLKLLDLSNVKCKTISDDAFSNCIKLEELHLQSNELEKFDVKCLPKRSFRSLNLRDNQIDEIVNYEQFDRLKMSNVFVDVAENLFNCTHLENLTRAFQRHNTTVHETYCYDIEVDLDD